MITPYRASTIKAWIIENVLKNPKTAIFFPVLFTLIMGIGVKYIVIDDNMMAMLPESLESKISWDAVQDEFGSTEVIFIAFGNKDKSIYNSNAFSSLWDLTKALENLDQVEKVSCITNISRIDSEEGFMEISDLQPNRELTFDQINNIRNYLNKNPVIKKRAISQDEDYFNIMIQPYENTAQDITRNKIKIGRIKKTSSYDVPYFISDLNYVKKIYKWEPRRNLKKVVADLYFWMLENNSILKKYF